MATHTRKNERQGKMEGGDEKQPQTAPVPSGLAKKIAPKEFSKASNIVSRSRWFRKGCDWVFEKMDQDKSGHINKDELYTGMLYMHLQCAKYIGPAACRPPSREIVESIFDQMDDDNSGHIDANEFYLIMMVLTSDMLFRIFVQYSLVFLLFPSVAGVLHVYILGPIGQYIFANTNAKSWTAFFLKWIPAHYINVTVISTVFYLLAIPSALDFIDRYFVRVAVITTGTSDQTPAPGIVPGETLEFEKKED